MTDQEKEIDRVIKYIRSCVHAGIDTTITIDKRKNHFILNALEEIKQYRAIGTIEQIEEQIILTAADKTILREYEKLGTVDECREAIRRRQSKNKLAYICSPYRGSTYQRIRNIAYARHVTRIALKLGYTPIATHLYLPKILNDNIPSQRRKGLNAGKNVLNVCNTIIIGTRYGISEGMKEEIRAAVGKNTIIIV